MSALNSATLRRLLLVAVVALFYGALCWNPQWMANLGVSHAGIWFMDTRGVLAASDADAAGINPYAPNPLDLLHQPHVYSGWWLLLHEFGITRGDYLWLGALLGFSFLALVLLQAGVRSWPEAAWSALLLTAPPVILGFNRGNADLVVFIVLAAVAPAVASARRWPGWFGVAAIIFAAGLKFYPAAAALVLLAPRRERRVIALQVAVAGLAVALVVLSHWDTLSAYAADRVVPSGFQMFGLDVPAQLLSWPPATLVLMAGFAAVALAAWRAPAMDAPQLVAADTLRFVVGAAVIVGSYFVTVNYAYRLIFALFATPFLWSTATGGTGPAYYRSVSRAAGVLIALALWFNGLSRLALKLVHPAPTHDPALTTPIVALEQPIDLALVAALLALLVPWVRDCLRRLGAEQPCRGR